MQLVNPIYKVSPMIDRIVEFKGLNKMPVVEEGELRDMKNMTSDEYPCLYQRKARGQYTLPGGIKKPISLLCKKEKLAIIGIKEDDTYAFYYDGEEIPQLKDYINASDNTKMVAINTKICFFPQKIYYSILDGSIGNLSGLIDGWEAGTIEETVYGQKMEFIVNTGDDVTKFKDFETGDAVNITLNLQAITEYGEVDKDVVVSAVIQDIGYEGIEKPFIIVPSETFLELSEIGATEGNISNITIDKSCPDLDYVMEYNNRLWGVSNADNTIYACKLGDPRNWQYFQNTSLDSYYAEQGTDGEWTGVAPYSGHMMFFKEQYIHKIYGTSPAKYQIVTAKERGVEKGSSKSIAIINDTVIYKSTIGIMAYDGNQPYLISQKLGPANYKDVVAGTDGIKYYASILRLEDGEYKPYMLCCDYNRGLWHKEDEVRASEFCLIGDELVFINESKIDYFDANKIYVINANNELVNEDKIKWMVEFAPFDEYIENKKIYSKMAMRLNVEYETAIDIYISVDGGEYEQLKHIEYYKDKVLFIPIVPRRCNKFSIKLEGVGRCRIESLSRKYRVGTGGML